MDPTRVMPRGVQLVHRWGFLLDNLPDWIGGGTSAGEFLLRTDGFLLRRSVNSTHSGGETSWRAGVWSEFHRFAAGTGHDEARRWLIDRGYDLADPSPVAVDSDTAGPFPGLPELFQERGGPR